MFQSSLRPKGQIRAVEVDNAWQIHDDIGALTFEDTLVSLPSRPWIDAIISEWPVKPKSSEREHKESLTQRDIIHIKPNRPATQVAQLALLGTLHKPDQYVQQVLNFLETDTLLFWQQSPSGIMQTQLKHWQPILEFIEARFGSRPEARFDLKPAEVPQNLIDALTTWLRSCSGYRLAGLVFLTGITGSIFLSTALAVGQINTEQTYQAACLEALYQREKWGADAEGDARLDRVRKSCILAETFLRT